MPKTQLQPGTPVRSMRLLDAQFVALIKQWRAIRARQQSARRITVGDTYEDAENFIEAMDRIASHAQGLGI